MKVTKFFNWDIVMNLGFGYWEDRSEVEAKNAKLVAYTHYCLFPFLLIKFGKLIILPKEKDRVSSNGSAKLYK